MGVTLFFCLINSCTVVQNTIETFLLGDSEKNIHSEFHIGK